MFERLTAPTGHNCVKDTICAMADGTKREDQSCFFLMLWEILSEILVMMMYVLHPVICLSGTIVQFCTLVGDKNQTSRVPQYSLVF